MSTWWVLCVVYVVGRHKRPSDLETGHTERHVALHAYFRAEWLPGLKPSPVSTPLNTPKNLFSLSVSGLAGFTEGLSYISAAPSQHG